MESFLTAITYCFCAHYFFNMRYPKNAEATLELMQKYILQQFDVIIVCFAIIIVTMMDASSFAHYDLDY